MQYASYAVNFQFPIGFSRNKKAYNDNVLEQYVLSIPYRILTILNSLYGKFGQAFQFPIGFSQWYKKAWVKFASRFFQFPIGFSQKYDEGKYKLRNDSFQFPIGFSPIAADAVVNRLVAFQFPIGFSPGSSLSVCMPIDLSIPYRILTADKYFNKGCR